MPNKITNNICTTCGVPCIKTVCWKCHKKTWWDRAKKAECHPHRKASHGTFCKQCWIKLGNGKRARCHPERANISKGLCQDCYNNSPERKTKDAELSRLRRYNLSKEAYHSLLQKQEYKCAICGVERPEHVDHSHKTKIVRGILCKRCNMGLGYFKDNIDLMTKAIAYLEQMSYTIG